MKTTELNSRRKTLYNAKRPDTGQFSTQHD